MGRILPNINSFLYYMKWCIKGTTVSLMKYRLFAATALTVGHLLPSPPDVIELPHEPLDVRDVDQSAHAPPVA